MLGYVTGFWTPARHLLDIGPRDRYGDEGLGLIYQARDPKDLRLSVCLRACRRPNKKEKVWQGFLRPATR